MDSKDAGHFLSSVFQADGGLSDMLGILGETSTSLESAFLPSVMLLVPQSYLTRNDRRVDVCGTVDKESDEYAEGYRFYSSEGEFFYGDGRCISGSDNPCDLVKLIDTPDGRRYAKPISPYTWVHPQHWDVKTWFHTMQNGRGSMVVGRYYRNRMGLAVEMVSDLSLAVEGVVFQDREGRRYGSTGKLLDAKCSMYDLVAEIRNWDIFKLHDWTSDKGVATKTKQLPIPELFDPTRRQHRPEKMAEFFEAMAKVNSLADELGIDLGFHMNTKNVNYG